MEYLIILAVLQKKLEVIFMAKMSLDEKIAHLEKELKNAKAERSTSERKKRNWQLMAFGILLETKYKTLPEHERAKIRGWADSLNKQTQARALEGFSRLDNVEVGGGGVS